MRLHMAVDSGYRWREPKLGGQTVAEFEKEEGGRNGI